jgi:hypothetical protein
MGSPAHPGGFFMFRDPTRAPLKWKPRPFINRRGILLNAVLANEQNGV